ncbi:MAG: molybdopterin-dependent oxidoreductase [Lachnospiraceae bacterium]|jgi:aldehyde oxidoreductase|nr:molybdopterin-dependent oxidoreductase [Lachnospiraceae bacterium]
MIKKALIINGAERTIVVDGTESLAQVLRDRLLLTGCKIGCGEGHCGACNVIVDGKVTRSCITKIAKVPDYAKVETIEGIGTLDDLHPLQAAWVAHGCAQCGFCSPGFIMSAKVLLENNPSPTREEVREWFNKNRNLCRCTGYKPLIDAVMDAAKVLRGEMSKEDLMFLPTDNKIIGTSYARPSGAAKVTGQWNFGADEIKNLPEDTLQIALVQAEVSHANIKGIDCSEAEKMPGVERIITYKDVPGKNRITGLITFPTNKGDGWDRPILCDEKVFQYGDAIAMVCADTVEHAKAAAAAVKVDLEILPAYMSAPEAMAPDAIEIHPGTPNVYYETNCIKGEDTAPIMETAPNVVEVEAYCSRQPHLPIEPDVAYAYTDEEGRVTIHSKSIGIHLHHAMICEGIGVAPEKLRLVQLHAGGTFGYKFSPTTEALVGVAALVTKRPVALNFSMYQMITYTGKRSPGFMNIKLAADEKGKLLALEGDNYIDHGPYSEFGDLLTMRLSQFVGAGMDIRNIRNKSQTVCTNHAYGAAFRGYGAPQSFMGGDIALDVMAAKMGIDPFEFRAMNCYKESEGSTTPNGCKPDVYCLEDLFDLARPKYQASKAYAEELNQTKSEDGKYKYGVGVSLGIYGCGLDGVDSSEAWAQLNADGTVTIYNSWEDHGQGADIGTLTHAHETLRQAGFTPDQIKLVMNDTGLTPNSGPAGGSRSNVMSGNATRVACEMLIDAMKKPDGTFRTYDEMKAQGLALKYEGKWVATGCSDCDMETAQGNPFSVYMYCISLPVVRVEMATGKVKVVKFTMVSDFGTIINKTVVDGQVMGAIAQGIGLALSEDFEDLKKHTTLQKCGIPYPNDVPDDIELIYQTNHPRPLGPYGAAGCGEGPLAAPHPAILNAIYNATGARVTKIPARPEVVKAAIDAL